MDINKIRCTVPCDLMTAENGCHCAEARDAITKLHTALEDIILYSDDYDKAVPIARRALVEKEQ